VLPKNFTVYDDPLRSHLLGLPVFGSYAFDDEGVPAQRVELVENGRLRSLLMSRTPRKEILSSNGHGRSGLSGWAQGKIANLVVEARDAHTRVALRQRLLRAAKEESLDYGLVVQRLDVRGFGSTGMAPPAPQRVYKLYPDGREVLVRGASLGELSVRDLRDIVAAGREPHAYSYSAVWPNGTWSPSTLIAPSLLFEEVEVNRPKAGHARPPSLEPPSLE
jgi:hypothetical protein